MSWSTRALTPDDLQSIYELYKKALAYTKFETGTPWSRPHFVDEFDHGMGWGRFEKGVLRAFLFGRLIADSLEITQLASDPDTWGKGLMRGLFPEVIEDVQSRQKIEKIWLEVHRENRAACRLYEDLGFKCEGQRPRYYRDGSDALLYSLYLPQSKGSSR